MIKKIITVLIVFAIIFGFYKITSQKPASITSTPTPDASLVLFFGDTCPHCKDVEEFISQNKIEEKIKINKFEVYSNKTNANLMSQMVKDNCPDNLNSEGLPVPFLINTETKSCFIGTPDITNHLTEKAK
ncbi:MAG TPA: hypothetical protein PK257_00975 [Candidatus Woesebacteria bacterium]|mgnify:CR=1 FL=1|nr:hypothetical protein [Candidatus Woesebacteria bacterium]